MPKYPAKPLSPRVLPKTAANNAVENYFDDLMVASDDLSQEPPGSQINDATVSEKINNAERLFTMAQHIALLMNDDDLSGMHKLDTKQAISVNAACETALSRNAHDTVQLGKPYFEDTPKVNIDMISAPLLVPETDFTQNKRQEISEHADIKDIQVIRDASISLYDHLDTHFQVLLCEVAGLTLAIPLVELGGIHQLTKVTPIAGKPKWFMGVLVKDGDTYQCIDTARWIMPEKYTAKMAAELDYKFAIQLGKTPYVLCCDSISTTIELSKDDVKWRGFDSKRPWLAGLLKEKMCALVDGARMVQVVLGNMQ